MPGTRCDQLHRPVASAPGSDCMPQNTYQTSRPCASARKDGWNEVVGRTLNAMNRLVYPKASGETLWIDLPCSGRHIRAIPSMMYGHRAGDVLRA